MIRESRLIGRRIETLQGKTDTTTQYNPRTAQANYDQQVLQYQAQLAANQAQTTGLNANGQGTLAATVSSVPTNTALANAQNTYANQAAGLQSQITQTADPSGMVQQSPVMTAGNGELEQNAIDRMRAAGMSDSEIRARISDPAYLQSISQAMSNTGLSPSASGLPDINTIKGYTTVVTTDPVTGRQVTTLMEEGNATKKAQQDELIRRTQQEQNNIQKNQKSAKTVEQGNAANAASNASKDPGMDTAFAALIGGTQDPALQNLLTAVQAEANAIGMVPEGEEMSRSEFNAGADAKAIANPYDATQKILDNAGKRAEQFFDQSQQFLKEQQDRNDKLLAAQEANIQEQLTWKEQKLTRDLADANRKELDRMTVSYALRGGYGSDDANNEVSQARWEGEQAIADLQKEFGFKRTDVALEFTDMTQKAHDAYTVNWLNAQNNLESRLSDLDLQGIANQQAKGAALDSAYKAYADEIRAGRKEYAAKLTEATKLVYNAALQEKDDQRVQEQLGLQQLDWAMKTYGQAVPQTFIDALSKKLPGLDVQQILTAPTLAQRKSSGGGGGGGGSSGVTFYGNQIRPDGQPISFDDFLTQKENEAVAAGADTFEMSDEAVAQYRKEYDAKYNNAVRLTPSALQEFLNDRDRNTTVLNLRETHQRVVDGYIADGQYEMAYEYIEGLGKPANATQQASFSKAASAKQNVNRIAALIEELGTTGPVIGQFRSANPYDDKVVEFNNLIRQTVPGLARGIFGEVGVLTDNDIKNYTATMANPNLTQDQARTATKNLLETINLSIENQLNVARASGTDTRDLKPIFQAIPDYEFGTVPQAEDPDAAFARSILLSQ